MQFKIRITMQVFKFDNEPKPQKKKSVLIHNPVTRKYLLISNHLDLSVTTFFYVVLIRLIKAWLISKFILNL